MTEKKINDFYWIPFSESESLTMHEKAYEFDEVQKILTDSLLTEKGQFMALEYNNHKENTEYTNAVCIFPNPPKSDKLTIPMVRIYNNLTLLHEFTPLVKSEFKEIHILKSNFIGIYNLIKNDVTDYGALLGELGF